MAFEDTKTALASTTTLFFPSSSGSFTLTTNVSSVAVGAVIVKTIMGTMQSLGFFSRKLRQAETRYSTFDRELLAIYLAVCHFKYLLERSPFIIHTDQQPLVHAFSNLVMHGVTDNRGNFRALLSVYPRKMNPVADTLSGLR
ncbi:hypothetical protein Pcinc_000572 [Petrolisthes cinctipes]|uniref:Reverse transcriptase/retrotransposon-derived protein RNase H-like domain-containing protein n=1 Tax=Petrolisthes cinctipes TaxID=88211 RepID=A0AAE1GMD7_PETCI|nr:hypothetical protein Pcinc_000572 [Petrolisthes cinctipes]